MSAPAVADVPSWFKYGEVIKGARYIISCCAVLGREYAKDFRNAVKLNRHGASFTPSSFKQERNFMK